MYDIGDMVLYNSFTEDWGDVMATFVGEIYKIDDEGLYVIYPEMITQQGADEFESTFHFVQDERIIKKLDIKPIHKQMREKYPEEFI